MGRRGKWQGHANGKHSAGQTHDLGGEGGRGILFNSYMDEEGMLMERSHLTAYGPRRDLK